MSNKMNCAYIRKIWNTKLETPTHLMYNQISLKIYLAPRTDIKHSKLETFVLYYSYNSLYSLCTSQL